MFFGQEIDKTLSKKIPPAQQHRIADIAKTYKSKIPDVGMLF